MRRSPAPVAMFFAAAILVAGCLPVTAASAAFHLGQRTDHLVAAAFDPGVTAAPLILTRTGATVTAVAGNPLVPPGWAVINAAVTVAPFGPGSALGGMNEKGLVIHLVWRDGVTAGAVDAQRLVEAMQWIRFNLDRRDRLADVIKDEATATIVASLPLQIFACDANGVCGVVEQVADTVDRRWSELLPFAIATGHPYGDGLAELTRSRSGGRSATTGVRGEPLERFLRLANRVEELSRATAPITVDVAFATLAGAVPTAAYPRFVYRPRERQVVVATGPAAAPTTVDLRSFVTRCGETVVSYEQLTSAAGGQVALAALAADASAATAAATSPLVAKASAELWAKVDLAARATECLIDKPDANPHAPAPPK